MWIFSCQLPVATNRLTYLLVLKDDFSQFVELVPSCSADAEVVVESLLNWFSRFGMVPIWISDQGTHFKNVVMKELSRRMKTKHHFTPVYSPWANGGIERMNKELLRVLRALLLENRLDEASWPFLLPAVQSVLNHSPSPRLGGLAPVEVMTGLRPSQPIDCILLEGVLTAMPELRDLAEVAKEHVDALRTALAEIHSATKHVRDRRTRARVQKHGGQPVNFAIGDFVLVAGRDPHKLQPFWQGPFRVIDTVNPWVYVVEDLVTAARREVHVCRIRKYADSDLRVTAAIRLAAEHDQVAHVSDISAHRLQDGEYYLCVRWLGFEEADNTWEPIYTLLEDVPAIVKSYMRRANDDDLSFAISVD